jgi:hypothetical protein
VRSSLADDRLLAELSAALAPASLVPDPARVDALRAVVAAHPDWDHAAGRNVAPTFPFLTFKTAGGRWRRSVVGAAAVLGLSTAGIGSAFAAGVSLPEPLRVLATAAGLPVDSPAVVVARHDEHVLSQRLTTISPATATPTQVAAVQQAAAALSRRVSHLGRSELARLGAAPARLLARAREFALLRSRHLAHTKPRSPLHVSTPHASSPTTAGTPAITTPG